MELEKKKNLTSPKLLTRFAVMWVSGSAPPHFTYCNWNVCVRFISKFSSPEINKLQPELKYKLSLRNPTVCGRRIFMEK